MKKSTIQLLLQLTVWVHILILPPVYGQAIPDTQWNKTGANLTPVADGNLVASIDGLPAGQIAGQGLTKYTLTGNPIWTTVLQGYTDLAGRLGLSKAPFQFVDNMAATTDGGVVVYGREFGTGLGVLTKVNAGGSQNNGFPQGNAFPLVAGGFSGLTVDDLLGTPDGGFLVVLTAFANFTDTHKDTFVYKYSSQGALSWTRQLAYPNVSPGSPDQRITKAEAAINAPDGGYLLAGYYSAAGPANPASTIPTFPATDFDPVPNSSHATGWVAKLDQNGALAWQKLLNGLRPDFINDGPAPGALVAMNTITDVSVSADGTGYALAGAGIGPSSIVPPPPTTGIVELATDGTFKRGRLNGLVPTKAFLTIYATGNTGYYALGTTSLQNGADPLIALIHPADLSKVVTQRTFDSPSNTSLRVVATLPDGSLGFSTSLEIYKLKTDALPGSAFALLPPAYDCLSGQLTISVSGANNTPLEYQVPGLRAWGPSPVFTVPTYQRAGTAFTLEARQPGQSASAPFTSNCVSATLPATGLALLPPLFDCSTGQLTLQVSGPATNLEYRVAGLRDWGPSPVFTVPVYQRTGTTFTLEARIINGSAAVLPFATTCGTGTPPPGPPAPPASDLTFAAPTLNCTGNSGAQLLINLVGIPFSPGNGIEYRIPGLADWQTNNAFAVPSYQTKGTTFTLYARRVTTQPQFTTQFAVNCPTAARQAVPEGYRPLKATLYPNPVGEQFTVEVSEAGQQAVRFDVLDSRGRLVQSREVDVQTDSHRETFLFYQATAGLYVVRVTTLQQVVTVKVLKP